mgnify:FL=1
MPQVHYSSEMAFLCARNVSLNYWGINSDQTTLLQFAADLQPVVMRRCESESAVNFRGDKLNFRVFAEVIDFFLFFRPSFCRGSTLS